MPEACATLAHEELLVGETETRLLFVSDFVGEGKTAWTGVRNYTARNNLRKMQKGDEVLFYHSGETKRWSALPGSRVRPISTPQSRRAIGSAVDLAQSSLCAGQ